MIYSKKSQVNSSFDYFDPFCWDKTLSNRSGLDIWENHEVTDVFYNFSDILPEATPWRFYEKNN
jgi:hypothetical protein